MTKCYWETQPQGCAKPHCPFLHQYPKVEHIQVVQPHFEMYIQDPIKEALPLRRSTSSRSPSPDSQVGFHLDRQTITHLQLLFSLIKYALLSCRLLLVL